MYAVAFYNFYILHCDTTPVTVQQSNPTSFDKLKNSTWHINLFSGSFFLSGKKNTGLD